MPSIFARRSLVRSYVSELRRELGYRPTWYAGTPRRPGEVGVLDGDGVFHLVTTLAALGVPFAERRKDVAEDRLQYESRGSVDQETTLKGQAAPSFQTLGELDAGLKVSFRREHAIALDATGVSVRGIADPAGMHERLRELADAGGWDPEWVFVREVIDARTCTVLVSSSRGSHVELKATADVAPAKLRLSSAEAGLIVTSASSMALNIVAADGMTPFYAVGRYEPLQRLRRRRDRLLLTA